VLERSNVGAAVHLRGSDGVVSTVTRDEGDLDAVGERRDRDGRRGLAPRLEGLVTW
jgi:hypothetical protein